MDTAPTFEGMGDKALPFLKALGFHQNKQWFQENKSLYEAHVRKPLGDLVEHLSVRMKEEGLPFHGSRKSSLFRINRDVRFSKDKNPYKTNTSALLSRDGTKKSQGFIYIQIGPDGCWVGSGFYGLSPDELGRMRRAIVARPSEVEAIERDLVALGYEISEHNDALKRNPRGFEDVSDPAISKLIRQKHFTVKKDVSERLILSPTFADEIIAFSRLSLPFIEFGWNALSPTAEAA